MFSNTDKVYSTKADVSFHGKFNVNGVQRIVKFKS